MPGNPLKKFTQTLLYSLLTLVIFFSATGPHLAAAQAPTPTLPANFTIDAITMEAYAAYDGAFKYGEWAPVWIEVSNSGPDLTAEVRVQVSGASPMIFSAPLELPSGARKRLPLFVLPNNFSRSLAIELVADGRQLGVQRVSLSPNPPINFLVGLVVPERGALAQIDDIDIPGTRRTVVLADVSLADLPERFEGLRSFDLIVINDVDTSTLTPGQVTALEGWVRQGGRLVIGGGNGALRTASGLGATLLPLQNIRTSLVDALPGLQAFVEQPAPPRGEDEAADQPQPRPILVPGPFIVAAGDAAGDVAPRILAEQDALPLASEWPIDKGLVDFVALDLAGSPFDAWNGVAAFWNRLAADSAAYPEFAAPDMSARQQFASSLTYPLSNLPMLDLPSVKGLAALLGIYILLVGPVNYLVLRRRNRFHLAWITIPAITLVFSLASFSIGYVLHGSDIFVNKIAVLQVGPDGRARVDSFIGLFSPAQSAYEVQIRDGGLISPLNPYSDPWSSTVQPGQSSRGVTLVQGNPAFVRGLSVEQWSMQSFMSEGQLMDFGRLESDLRLEGESVVGHVRNTSAYDLADVIVIIGTQFARLGDLAAGAAADVNLSLVRESSQNFGMSISYLLYQDELSGANGQSTRQVEVRRAIVEALLERTPPYISAVSSKRFGGGGSATLSQSPIVLAWLDQAPPQVEIAGAEPAQQTTAVVIQPVSYVIPESGDITLPPGQVPGKLVETPREGGQCGMTGATAVYISRGDAVFEYTLPAELRAAAIRNLKLNIVSDAGFFTAPEAAVYDWQAAAWLPLQGVNQGMNLIPATQALVSDDGAIRLRLSGENLQYCYYLDLGVEATR